MTGKAIHTLTVREAADESWALLEASREKHENPPSSLRYKCLGIAQQTLATLRKIARNRGLDPQGSRSELVRTICQSLAAIGSAEIQHTMASALLARLRAIDLDSVPVSDFGRCERRKDRAKAFRALFKQLGLKGISVTAPNYSMAQSVDVRLPRIAENEHVQTRWPHDHGACCGSAGHTDETRCPACREFAEMRKRIEAILWKGFPNLRDRSDSMTDYFNYCWSVD